MRVRVVDALGVKVNGVDPWYVCDVYEGFAWWKGGVCVRWTSEIVMHECLCDCGQRGPQ